jgi:hypothetical protein
MRGNIIVGLLQILLEAVFEPVCYYAGRVVVLIISLGRWSCDGARTPAPRRELRAAGFFHLRGDRVFVTAAATHLVGLASMILVIGLAVFIWYISSQ